MSCEESVPYFKLLENLEKIRRTSGPNPSSQPVNNKKYDNITSSVDQSSKNPKGFNMWCHYCDKNKHNTLTAESFLSSNEKKAFFEAKSGLERSLWSSFSKKSMHSKGS
jgi:hypothetical protein